ncbi:NAD(P)-binding protein [Aaosphaeria arxii CBS 175.79]|uniref:NAD(P)-binding protein n=1 Tax=Aaosphaeria arxii CBS 175.79 TaxID=1450172 RepID=A0A6A5XBE9_9PLEO|nr:NAD(P)-binding protein [Aaosphaeria arxii CBS 175.79]KAF2010229.1 NAD(P)-binding protein [Aaosphaeria arxii CBS 175.79]
MRVAIAGSGDVTRYLSEELVAAGIDVVILSRSCKPQFENRPGVHQHVTDYSVPSLIEGLQGSTTLISTVLDYTQAYIDVHMRLIEAAQKVSSVKRFIASEYGGNVEDFPDQPGFYGRIHGPVREALRGQDQLEWTMVAVGWLMDYIVPAKNRYMKDIEDAFPINLKTKKVEIPGTGNEKLDFTAVRDMARGIAKLVQTPDWEENTYMSGEKMTWNEITALVGEKYGGFEVKKKSLYDLIQDVVEASKEGDEWKLIGAEYKIFSPSGAGDLPVERVQRHQKTYFEGLKFRTCKELLDEVDSRPDAIL